MTDDQQPTADGGKTAVERRNPGEALLERFTDGVVTVDADQTVTRANDTARELLGAADAGLVGEPVREAFPGGTQPEERFERALATGEATTVETFDPGQDRWIEARVYPSGTGAGAEADAGLSVVLRDVTEHRQASEEVRDSERSFQRLHNLASDPDRSRSEKLERMLVVGCERLGLELGVLTRVEDTTGRVVETIGDHPGIRVGTEASLPESYCRRLFGGEDPVVFTDGSAAPDGHPAHEQFGLETYVGAPVSVDEETYGTICFAGTEPREREFSASELTFVDLLADWVGYIIEQRRYETQLRGEQHRLETIIENVPVVVFALDADGVFTLSRGHGLTPLESEPGDAVGESIFERYSGYPAVCAHARRALDGQEAHHTVEMDSGHTLEAWYQPVVEEGEVVQVVGVARDITELVEHRERLSGLLETAQSLMQARSREEGAELAAAASRDVLGFLVNVVRICDSDAQSLSRLHGPWRRTRPSATGPPTTSTRGSPAGCSPPANRASSTTCGQSTPTYTRTSSSRRCTTRWGSMGRSASARSNREPSTRPTNRSSGYSRPPRRRPAHGPGANGRSGRPGNAWRRSSSGSTASSRTLSRCSSAPRRGRNWRPASCPNWPRPSPTRSPGSDGWT